MPTLAQIYEEHAKECFRSAAREDDPKQRNLLLKLAIAWREDAEALKQGRKCSSSQVRGERRKHRGALRKARRVMQHLRLPRGGVTSVE
jgi:hypothetical protein